MGTLYFVHKLKSFLIDRRPKGFGRLLKLIDSLFFRTLPNGEILIKTLYGFPMYINPSYDKGIERKLYLTGSYEKGLLYVIDQLLGPGDVVVDAGANIGLISVFCCTRVGKAGLVMSFEPHPDTVSILRRNIELNKLSQAKVFDTALGSVPGTARIYSNLQINRGAASMVDFQDGAPSFEIKVEVLDQLLAKYQISQVKLLKIDVEGFEMEVLKGAQNLISKGDGPILVVECSTTRQNFQYSMEDLFYFLTTRQGYKIFRFAVSKEKISKLVPVDSVDMLPQHDNIVAFKAAHLDVLKNSRSLF